MGGSQGLSNNVTAGEQANSNALVKIAQQQNANAQTLFGESQPGFNSAEQFYAALSTGDPSAIMRAISPATQQIGQATASSKANILANAPNGGEKNLALEQADVNQGAQVGNVATQGYLNSFNALAGLAGQGIGQSISSASTGISGIGQSTQALGQLGNQQIQQKGATLGALGGLAGTAGSLAGSLGSAAILA